jgi:hypothetical protein
VDPLARRFGRLGEREHHAGRRGRPVDRTVAFLRGYRHYKPGRTYKDYAAAYQAGYEGRNRHRARTFEEVERDLEIEYNKRRAENGPPWEESRVPARAAWDRVERIIPSEAGHGRGKS